MGFTSRVCRLSSVSPRVCCLECVNCKSLHTHTPYSPHEVIPTLLPSPGQFRLGGASLLYVREIPAGRSATWRLIGTDDSTVQEVPTYSLYVVGSSL